MAVESNDIPLGTPAPDFALPDIEGRTVSLSDLFAGTTDRPSKAVLVAFLCNHCPYVQHIEQEFGRIVEEFAPQGLATVGICTNDAADYPDDAPAGLREQAARAGWTFPYLVDGTQEVGRSYRAACTPDLFLFDSSRRLAYHGAMDASSPKNNVPLSGDLLRGAVELVLQNEPVPTPHRPAMGCSIKWR